MNDNQVSEIVAGAGGRTNMTINWRQAGYPSKEAAELMNEISNPDTSKTIRQALIEYLHRHLLRLSGFQDLSGTTTTLPSPTIENSTTATSHHQHNQQDDGRRKKIVANRSNPSKRRSSTTSPSPTTENYTTATSHHQRNQQEEDRRKIVTNRSNPSKRSSSNATGTNQNNKDGQKEYSHDKTTSRKRKIYIPDGFDSDDGNSAEAEAISNSESFCRSLQQKAKRIRQIRSTCSLDGGHNEDIVPDDVAANNLQSVTGTAYYDEPASVSRDKQDEDEYDGDEYHYNVRDDDDENEQKEEELAIPGKGYYKDEWWLAHYENLKAYRKQHGHCNVPQSKGKLGTWVSRQRAAFRKKEMREDRKDLLNMIGFQWIAEVGVGPNSHQYWLAHYENLKAYRKQHGHCNVPSSKGKLGTWVSRQRTAFRKKEMREDRKDLLNMIGFQWIAREPGPKSHQWWLAHYENLKAYHKQYGHCNVPQSKGKLGTWVSQQRVAFRKKKMREDQKDLLNMIGFQWITREPGPESRDEQNEDADEYDDDDEKEQEEWAVPCKDDQHRSHHGMSYHEQWLAQYNNLKAFHKRHGHCNVSMRHNLWGWVQAQRYEFAKDKMNDDRVNLLNRIGFVWRLPSRRLLSRSRNAFHELWLDQYENLKAFHKQHGHCNVPQTEASLWRWVRRQRLAKDKMKDDRVNLLNRIGFVWRLRPPRED